ncbi:MAG: hypothetical protein ACFBSE_22065, partial [Prochloraceae cyanobacterium]
KNIKIATLAMRLSRFRFSNTFKNRQGSSQTVSLTLAIKKLCHLSTIVARPHQQKPDTSFADIQ